MRVMKPEIEIKDMPAGLLPKPLDKQSSAIRYHFRQLLPDATREARALQPSRIGPFPKLKAGKHVGQIP